MTDKAAEKNGTAKGEYMHESIEKDAVKYDLPTEEIIAALCLDNTTLLADNKAIMDDLDKTNIKCCALLADKARLEEEARWIPVGERLPEEGKIVLVAGGIAKYIDGRWWSGMEEPLYRREIIWEVTHWKPITLPEVKK